MKKITFLLISFGILILSGCGTEGPMGPQGPSGQDGLDAEVYSSDWVTPNQWAGVTKDWYFDVDAPAITDDILDYGVILGYISVKNDVYEYAVRQMPAYVNGINYEFLCPHKGVIEFMSDDINYPPTSNILFRYVIIPSNIALKSASFKNLSMDQIKKLPYEDLCNKLGISK